MKVLTTLDLAKNQLINVRIENQASAPSNPVEGQIYYDTTDHTLKQYNGTAWVEMGSSYILPTASANTLGGIKIGDLLSIDQNGVASVNLVFETTYDATTNKAATMADITSAISALGTLLDLKGTKATYAEIEAIVNPEVGDVWICTADNSEYVYVDGDPSGHWEKLGPTIDLSGYLQIANLASDLTGESTTTAPTQKAVHDALALKADAADLMTVTTVTISSATSGTANVPTGKAFAGYYAYETSTNEQVIFGVSIASNVVTFTSSVSGNYTIKAYFK